MIYGLICFIALAIILLTLWLFSHDVAFRDQQTRAIEILTAKLRACREHDGESHHGSDRSV